MKHVEALILVFALCGSIFTGYFFIDDRYALAEEHKELKKRLDRTEINLAIQQLLQHYYFLKGQLKKYPDDEEIKEEIKQAKEDYKDLKDQLKQLKEDKK